MVKRTLVILQVVLITIVSIFAQPVFGVSAASTAQRFMEFANSSDATFDINNLNPQDYFTLYTFYSNWFKPGETTLADIVSSEDGENVFSEFVGDMNSIGNPNFSETFKSISDLIAQDVVGIVNAGNGKLKVDGEGFLKALANKQSIKYKGGTAFEVGSPAVEAMFKVLNAYNAELFANENGIASYKELHLDACGNLWGLKDGVDKANKADYVLLIPACINPAVFSGNLANKDTLKFPLLNSFTIGYFLNLDSISDKDLTLPLMNLFSNVGVDKSLIIYGLHSFSPHTLNYKEGANFTKQEKQHLLACLASCPNSVFLNVNDKSGLFNTCTKVVIAPNLANYKSEAEVGWFKNLFAGDPLKVVGNHYVFDTDPIGFNDKFSVSKVLGKDSGKLLQYLYSPVNLDINNVSMHFYNDTGSFMELIASNSSSTSFSEAGMDLLFDKSSTPINVTEGNSTKSYKVYSFANYKNSAKLQGFIDTYSPSPANYSDAYKFPGNVQKLLDLKLEGSYTPTKYVKIKGGAAISPSISANDAFIQDNLKRTDSVQGNELTPSVPGNKQHFNFIQNYYAVFSTDSISSLFPIKEGGKVNIVNSATMANSIYLSYMVDILSVVSSSEQGPSFGSFGSPYIPTYNISARGQNASYTEFDSEGIEDDTEDSFTAMQKRLIERAYALLDTKSSDYRIGFIQGLFVDLCLNLHRYITGTIGSQLTSVMTGASTVYSAVTGFVYTPNLNELPFGGSFLDNYGTIYVIVLLTALILIICMFIIGRLDLKGMIGATLLMAFSLFLPFVSISATTLASNTFCDKIFSDRFEFWAMTDHQNALSNLVGINWDSERDAFIKYATLDSKSNEGNAINGVRVRWMAPKRTDYFDALHIDNDYSKSLVTNMEVYKWLFSSLSYDMDNAGGDNLNSYVYRSYQSLAIEAGEYYNWGKELESREQFNSSSVSYAGSNFTAPGYLTGFVSQLDSERFNQSNSITNSPFISGFTNLQMNSYTRLKDGWFNPALEKRKAMAAVSNSHRGSEQEQTIDSADAISVWGYPERVAYKTRYINKVSDEQDKTGRIRDDLDPGISSILNKIENNNDFSNFAYSDLTEAIYLKNTESPFYYFYSYLKDTIGEDNFKSELLDADNFIVSAKDLEGSDFTKANGSVKDFLGLEGLFSGVIPVLSASNDYVNSYIETYGSDFDSYAFDVVYDENGNYSNVDNNAKFGESDNAEETYIDAVRKKEKFKHVWNMYSPWVSYLQEDYEDAVLLKYKGHSVTVDNPINPSSYLAIGRPMLCSEAEMQVCGYTEADLTPVEIRCMKVLADTRKDLQYLVNYYDLDNEVLLVMAAMKATFNFDKEFSSFNKALYPTGFELKNFNYDAYMKLALLNATGEEVFSNEDLYLRVLSKVSFISGIFLIICDILGCIVIPTFKFTVLLLLMFLGIVFCMRCLTTDRKDLAKDSFKIIVEPVIGFAVLNVGFALVLSMLVGDGLDAYVGGHGMSLSPNNPVLALVIMGFISGVYCYITFKLIKNLWKALKLNSLSLWADAMSIGSSLKSSIRSHGRRILGGAGIFGGLATAAYLSDGKGMDRFADMVANSDKGIRRQLRDKRTMRKQQEFFKDLASQSNSGSANVSDTTNSENKVSKDDRIRRKAKRAETKLKENRFNLIEKQHKNNSVETEGIRQKDFNKDKINSQNISKAVNLKGNTNNYRHRKK